ncbi:hypothetical protein AC579_6777 [Pseudocercospora musae]|uniref:Uncharacterized protein n=1 Tax=Pseudocercospora musae TaxID=113226 RepID=A0A139I3V2_9PEZI|nr:hypothetical protein AC579_6777 [Pseudocercospora musae]
MSPKIVTTSEATSSIWVFHPVTIPTQAVDMITIAESDQDIDYLGMELNDSELDIKALTERVEAQAMLDALPCEDTVHVRIHGRRTAASQWCIVALFFGSSVLAIMTLLLLPRSSASSISNGAILDRGKSQT